MAQVNESSALTGQELLDLLLSMQPEELALPIVFGRPSHDHWGTQLAGEVHQLNQGQMAWSEYHRAFRTLDENQMEKARNYALGEVEEGESDELSEEELANLKYDNQPILKALVIE